MAWIGPGRSVINEHWGGRHGGYVQLGESMVPRKLTFTFEGDGGTPDLAIHLEVRDGRPEVVEFRITAKENGRGIRTSDLQSFPLDVIAVNAFTEVAIRPKPNPSSANPNELVYDEPPGGPDEQTKRSMWHDVNEAGRSTRGNVSPAELERVADIYRQYVDSSPTRMVAMLLGLSERTAARRVQQARAAGLLPKTTRGKRKA